MAKKKSEIMIPNEVETKQLKRAVRHNITRFPEDFMFELTLEEFSDLRNQFGTSSWGGARYVPMAFTEHGVISLATILNSKRAIQVNVQIVRIFIKMREILTSHKEILHRLDKIEHKMAEHNNQILVIFKYLKQLEQTKQHELEQKNRNPIGYKRKGYHKPTTLNPYFLQALITRHLRSCQSPSG